MARVRRDMSGFLVPGPASRRHVSFPNSRPRVDRSAQPTQLYRHFNSVGVLLYVGISLSAVNRLSQHKESFWFNKITHIEVETFPSRASAISAEAEAIASEKPLYNQKGAR
jgi:hypothetical protein